MKRIRTIIYGCGVMGRGIASTLLEKQSFELVGAIDINPELAGKDIGEVLEPPRRTGIIIEKNASDLLSRVNARGAVLTTASHLEKIFPQLKECIEAGLNVVSTCEELSYPFKRHPHLSAEIDSLARKHGVTVVGTGINPGFLMDTLPLILTAPCLSVSSIRVTRMMNSARRRIPFQKKVGTGLTQEEFRRKIKEGIITGHVGLLESTYIIADGLGWEIEEAVELPPQPVVDDKEIDTGLGAVKPGDVIGLVSTAFGRKDGKEVITLEFNANAAISEEYDEIIIIGEPNIHQRIIGGVHGDTGTVAVAVNTLPRAVEVSPGLRLMKDLPLPSATP
ncbi:MAG: dihydrodipicolinate reductase [Candidatus Aminicenantales bacterium]